MPAICRPRRGPAGSHSHTDRRALRAVLDERPSVPGDVYDLKRVKGGRHGAIMKYGLNTQAGPGTRGSVLGDDGSRTGEAESAG